ncbi:hypothetical protein AAG570_000985 [Ranatra chinensis]|uniref:Protein Wnt n=1 Tax=Ranatra chinensis TaxID=642074 RepID=A0ABD0YAR7_9HEMI
MVNYRDCCDCCRGIAKAGEPNNLLPLSPGMLYMDPTVHATLRRKQRRLVRENPGVLVAISKGAKQAILECQFQFRNRRWNCSTKNFLRGKNLFGKIVDRGKRSTFVPLLVDCMYQGPTYADIIDTSNSIKHGHNSPNPHDPVSFKNGDRFYIYLFPSSPALRSCRKRLGAWTPSSALHLLHCFGSLIISPNIRH